MLKKIAAVVLMLVLATAAYAAVNDYVQNGVSVGTSSTTYDFTTGRSFVVIRNDGSTNSVFVVWYKVGDTLPANGAVSSGGFEVKPGEPMTRETRSGYLQFSGVAVYTTASTTTIRILAGNN